MQVKIMVGSIVVMSALLVGCDESEPIEMEPPVMMEGIEDVVQPVEKSLTDEELLDRIMDDPDLSEEMDGVL